MALSNIPPIGQAPTIKTITAYYAIDKGANLAQDIILFKGAKGSSASVAEEVLSADGRQYVVRGIRAIHNLVFPGVNPSDQDQQRLAFELATKVTVELKEGGIMETPLAALLPYNSIVKTDNSVDRVHKDEWGLWFEASEYEQFGGLPSIVPNRRFECKFSNMPPIATDNSASTAGIPGYVKPNQYYIALMLEVDANSIDAE